MNAVRGGLLALILVCAHTGEVRSEVLCNLVTTFETGISPTRTVHVATSGNDSSGDGSAGAPYRTIGRGVDAATPGTAVVIHAGAYSAGEFLDDVTGSASAPIWIGGAAGEDRPVISGGSEGLHLTRPKYVVLHDLEIRNAANNGVNIDDGGDVADPLAAHHVIVRGLDIHDIGGSGNQDGLKLSGLRDFTVLDCTIARTGGGGSGSGVDMVGCHRGLIARCGFTDMSANAVQVKGGSADVEIRWCRVTNGGGRCFNVGGSTGFEFFRPPLSTSSPNAEARNIRVVANVLRGGDCAVAFVGAVECLFAHNTVDTPGNWILRILQETTSTGSYAFLPSGSNAVRGNVFYFDRGELSTYVNIGPDTAPATFSFARNLWYAYDNPASSTPTLPTSETGGIYGQDPQLVSPANGDYRITSASPAAGAGTAAAPVPTDYLGTPYANPPSLGALEVQSGVDADCSGAVELGDHVAITDCMEGPGEAVGGYCLRADFDFDQDVDLADWQRLTVDWP